jgi:uncharacterized coiled-coil protein SlyX
LPDRRRSSVLAVRAVSHDVSKSIELEQRIARLELHIADLTETLDTLTNRTVSIRAELDHLDAKRGRLQDT